jgi:hypothetical protein
MTEGNALQSPNGTAVLSGNQSVLNSQQQAVLQNTLIKERMMLLSEEAMSAGGINPLSMDPSLDGLHHLSDELRAEHKRLIMAKIE